MKNGNAQKNKDIISILMMTQLQRLLKGLAVCAILTLVLFLLQPDFGENLMPYEVQLYLNPYYRYGVWIIFFGLVFYCMYDVYVYTSNSYKITPYQQIPVSIFKQHMSWVFSVTCIFALYFLWQILLFIIFLSNGRTKKSGIRNGKWFVFFYPKCSLC